VENGKFVRMALICKLLEWKDDPTHTMPEGDVPLLDDTLHCNNSKCICNHEGVQPRFRVTEEGVTRCWYCDSKVR
jgi:aspartate carbamoyltransferase catalytic subunit